jgi:hypothetical protein
VRDVDRSEWVRPWGARDSDDTPAAFRSASLMSVVVSCHLPWWWHRFVEGCQYTACCSTSSLDYVGWWASVC